MLEHVKNNLLEAKEALDALLNNPETLDSIVKAGAILSECFRKKGHVYSCGNGGSMCDAMHFAEELSGRFRKDRPALGAVAMADGAYLTCAGNDFGFDQVFARFLEAQGRAGDVLVAISTSGRSPNVIEAAKKASQMGVSVIGMTGKPNSQLSEFCDVEICTPAGAFADRVQELHIKVIHTLIELVERELFNEDYN